MDGLAPRQDYVVYLAGGLPIPAEAWHLFRQLDQRTIRLQRKGGTLLVSPKDLLTPRDRDRIRHWKHHLLTLVDYVALD